MRDFSRVIDVRFRIDHVGGEQKGQPEFFEGVPGLAALQLIEFAGLFDRVQNLEDDPAQAREMFTEMMNLVLVDESAERFVTRLGNKVDPISLAQVMEIVPYLMEEYGMRPTKPSGDSSSLQPSPDDGTRLTQPSSSAQVVPLLSPSPQTGS